MPNTSARGLLLALISPILNGKVAIDTIYGTNNNDS